MCGNGRRATFSRTQAIARSPIPSIPKCFLETNTKSCAAARGRRDPARCETAFATGTIRFGDRSSPASAVRAMTSIDAIVNSAGSGDAEERRRAMLADVREGLSRRPRELPPKYFYDERGSRLFEEITRLPEYYLTRAEREILVAQAARIVELTNARTLVELGAGSAAKTRILLAAMRSRAEPVTYVPIDVSEEFLEQTRDALEEELPWLRVEPVVADMNVAFELPPVVDTPVLFAFLGSTIGNFDTPSAIALLRRIADHMRADDRLLLGTDLR